MNNFFKHINSKYFTSIGDGSLSPLNQAIVGLCMTYIDCFKEEGFEKKPLVIGIPNKQWATVWIASGLMTNLFYREASNQNTNKLNELNLKKGDRIELFGKSTKWQGINAQGRGQILVKQSTKNAYGRNERSNIVYPLPDRWIPFINKDLSNRSSIISVDLIRKKLRVKQTTNTALEKILNYNEKESLGINPKSLKGKVLIVSGRGDKGKFMRQIKETIVCDEPLSDIFLLNHNLFVEVDLENYKNVADSEFEENKNYFKQIALKQLTTLIPQQGFLSKKIDILLKLIKENQYLSNDFVAKFESLIDLVEEENEELLEEILEEHPGVVSSNIDNLRAVIINDIDLVNDYQKTINSLCQRDIPVIILSDFYANFDNSQIETEDYYRFFWGTKKIYYLIKQEQESVLLDDKLWELSKRFSEQFINIEVVPSSNIESDFFKLSRTFYSIEGLENLKKIFWSTFFPAFHIIKNTPGTIERNFIENLTKEFTDELKKLRGQVPEIINDNIKKVIRFFSNELENNKALNNEITIFQQEILINGKKYLNPNVDSKGITILNKTDFNTSEITFTGEPYKEKYIGYLKKAILYDFIPTVKVICWVNEGNRLADWLKSIYQARFFTDNIKQVFNFSDSYLLSDYLKIKNEINEIIIKTYTEDELADKSTSKDNLFDYLREYNHSKYKQTTKEEGVSTDILTFTNGDWMYLPKGSKILAVKIKTDGTIGIKKYKFNELTTGMQIIQYRLGTTQLRKMAKNKKELDSIFNNLNIWRNALEMLYGEIEGVPREKYKELEARLNALKNQRNIDESNPNILNLIRWRNDDELLAPAVDNLKLILIANHQFNLLDKVIEAKRKVRKFDNNVRKQIKEESLRQIERIFETEVDKTSFSINVKGFGIRINLRTILNCNEESIYVSYASTRKIITE